MSVRAERRTALRAKLIEVTSKQIAKNGLRNVTARSVASEADCAVGSIYTIFEDLDALFIAVNMQSFEMLAGKVARKMIEEEPETPTERLKVLAHSYFEFVQSQQNLWKALFQIDMGAESDAPKDYKDLVRSLLSLIGAPLLEISPDSSPKQIDTRARALFSSVHGIILLGIEGRLSAVSTENIGEMIDYLVETVS
ncbi:MAG: TetR/AcrR family transcriptional regulator [Pseudomonadota bacterium]